MPRAGTNRFANALLAAACAVFVISRVWVLGFAPIERSTVGVFAEMGFEYRLAAAQGESFYELHARRASADAAQRQALGLPGADTARRDVEYPPLAVAWMVLPTYFAETGDFDGYKTAFRAIHAAVDAITFLLTWYLARRIGFHPGWPLMVYALGGLALYPVLYDRVDLAMAALVAAALALLVSRIHWVLGLLTLALAVNFKLVPLVVAPAFVIGSTPLVAASDARRFVITLIIRSGVLAPLCILMFVPFYLVAGGSALRFLDYHADRGVQVESVPASVLLLAGQVTGLTYTHGAVDIVSPASGGIALGSTLVTLLLLAVVSLGAIAWARRAGDSAFDPAAHTIAQAHPLAIVLFATLLLWSAMSTAKVLSPQYVVWLLPLAPLVTRRPLFGGVFVVMCALTTVIFPHRYYTDIARIEGADLVVPTAGGVLLLTARNGLLIALLGVVAVITWRRLGAARANTGHPDAQLPDHSRVTPRN